MDRTPLFLILLAALWVVLALGLAAFARAQRRLRREQAALADRLARQGNDLLGLCAAAVQVDRRLLELDRQLGECLERTESLAVHDAGSQPYHSAIDKVRKGAGPEELVAEFGLSQSEASLLARLYGGARG